MLSATTHTPNQVWRFEFRILSLTHCILSVHLSVSVSHLLTMAEARPSGRISWLLFLKSLTPKEKIASEGRSRTSLRNKSGNRDRFQGPREG